MSQDKSMKDQMAEKLEEAKNAVGDKMRQVGEAIKPEEKSAPEKAEDKLNEGREKAGDTMQEAADKMKK